MKTKLVTAASFIWLIALLTPVLTISASQPTEPPFLRGEKLDLEELYDAGITEWQLPVDQPFYVVHGWVILGWNEGSGEGRRMILDDSQTGFDLYIDGDPQKLRKWWICSITETGEHTASKLFYIQCDPYEFEAGSSYEFEGYWYSPGMVMTRTVTITFT